VSEDASAERVRARSVHTAARAFLNAPAAFTLLHEPPNAQHVAAGRRNGIHGGRRTTLKGLNVVAE